MGSIRQSELFAGQDWKVIHKAFTEINFSAYDFDSIRLAMRDYIRMTYPEEFNDWIESSEFVAIIDLLAYLGGAIAFRVDMNAHENFMDTAEARESILRTARFLSYNPHRNYPARGMLKVTAISTNDDIFDSIGQNLNGQTVVWADAQNPDWFEQWTAILNNALIGTNQFGTPLKTGTVGGVRTHLYRFNSLPQIGNIFPFTRNIDSNSVRFEVVNLDFEDFGTFSERTPDPLTSFHISYRNDGNGNSSSDTGFFLYFKQGELKSQTFNIQTPQENRVIEISDPGVNELDVWVQNVGSDGLVERGGYWRKVQTVQNGIYTSDNITYNSIPAADRNIYQVVTGDNDTISLRFSDGRFGAVPMGTVRCFYRTSNGIRYTIRPSDIANVTINIPYRNQSNIQKTLTVTLSLQNAISNSVPRETDEDIKHRAPLVYYTQNRMVSGEDYQNFPTQNNLAKKIKAVNRIYSGQSRYIDLNDPTGTYQNTNVFSDDGILYRDFDDLYFELPLGSDSNQTSIEILDDVITPFIQHIKMRNFIWDQFLFYPDCSPSFNYGPWIKWNAASGTTGAFRRNAYGTTQPPIVVGEVPSGSEQTIGPLADVSEPLLARLISETAMVKFAKSGWVTVNSISGDGAGIVEQNNIGRVRLSSNVASGDLVLKVIPAFRTTLDSQETTAILAMLNSRKSFGIGYDHLQRKWYIIDPAIFNPNGEFSYTSRGTDSDSSWLISVQYNSDVFRIVGRGLVYVFESVKDVRFFQFNTFRQYNNVTGLVDQDHVKILSINEHPSANGSPSWAANTYYWDGKTPHPVTGIIVPESYVVVDNTTFVCKKSHTSSSTFSLTNETDVLWQVVQPSLGKDVSFGLVRPFVYRDGYIEPRRVQVTPYDSDYDGVPDNPEAFYEIVGTPYDIASPQYLFWEKYIGVDEYEYYRPLTTDITKLHYAVSSWVDINNPNLETIVNINGNIFRSVAISELEVGDMVLLVNQASYDFTNQDRIAENHIIYTAVHNGQKLVLEATNDKPGLIWTKNDGTFWQLSSNEYVRDQYGKYDWNIGRDAIKFQWKHLAPRDHRIDPAITNIIDIFVLTSEYDTVVRNWIKTNKPINEFPAPPTDLELKLLFQDIEQYKMFSDEIVWRPVKYKLLFGARADEEYRVAFKVKKTESTSSSDGEIRAQVIRAINEFFQVSRWDFGETFNWSELSAYIHHRLATMISSIYLVPINGDGSFGNLVDIKCEPDELPISVATVDDVMIIAANTQANLRIR